MSNIEKSPEVDIIIYFVNTLLPNTVLEVGCNYGREIKQLELNTNARIYGIDVDESKIEKAKKYALDSYFKVADASQIPYNAGKFDLVYSSGVFAHSPPEKIKSIIYEMFRVSGKYILLVEYIGSHLSKNTVGNCKQNAWIHDYNKLISGCDVVMKYNEKIFFGTDCFQVLLMKKEIKKIEKFTVIKEIPQEKRFEIKIGKFKVGF